MNIMFNWLCVRVVFRVVISWLVHDGDLSLTPVLQRVPSKPGGNMSMRAHCIGYVVVEIYFYFKTMSIARIFILIDVYFILKLLVFAKKTARSERNVIATNPWWWDSRTLSKTVWGMNHRLSRNESLSSARTKLTPMSRFKQVTQNLFSKHRL